MAVNVKNDDIKFCCGTNQLVFVSEFVCLVMNTFLALDTCNVDCVRERMKQKLQSAMRTLRKSINKQQFYIQFSGTEYEVAQKPSRAPEGAEACSTGQVLRDGKCGKLGVYQLS